MHGFGPQVQIFQNNTELIILTPLEIAKRTPVVQIFQIIGPQVQIFLNNT